MVNELKVSKSYSLHPTVIAWATQKAALLSLTEGRAVSASEIINEALTQAMQVDSEAEDTEHIRRLLNKVQGKKKS